MVQATRTETAVTTEPAIAVSHLVVERGGRRVLDNVSCTIPRGSVVGLLGPSGSGKTTFMRAVVGVQHVASGTVQVLGEAAGAPELRHRVGYLTQAPSIYPDLTVFENARYFGTLHGVGVRGVEESIAAVGLAEASRQLVSTLSGGQRARASLACTLLGNPELLVLDEPTVGQDPLLRNELWQRFRALAAGGATLLVSSHVMDEARRCDRLLFISEGRLIADATPAEVAERTSTDDLDEAFLRLVVSERAGGQS